MAEGSSTGENLAGCAPEGDVFASISVRTGSKLLVNFAESLKKQNNKEDEQRAKNMYLESLAPGTIKSIVDSRGLFLTWHNHTYPGKTVTLPLCETEIKKFFVSCARAGFTYTRLTNNILRGICMWHTANNETSPAKTYPELGSTIMKFLRKEVGEMDILPKKPLFEQDLEFIVDCTGIITPAALQLSFLHCLSATCAARPTSLAETYVREEIEELREELGLGSYPAGAGLSIGDVEFRSDPTLEITMCITFSHEKPQAANKSHKRVFVVTPKKPGSPYCAVTLGFLHIARRGAFKESPADAWRSKNFIYKEDAKKWPLFAQVDTSTQTLKNTMAITTNQLSRIVTSSISSVGFNPREVSHRSYRSGFATRFVLNAAMENGGRFSDHQVDQLRRLGGWSPKSAIVHLYIKKIIEEYSDAVSLITPGLRTEEDRVKRLRNLTTAYNFRLELPRKNIATKHEAEALFPEEYEKFLREYEPLKKLQAEDATNQKRINRLKETATQVFCRRKNEQQHDERRKQPATPPKPTTTRTLDVLVEISSWNNLPQEDLVHLDCRSRWIPPNEGGEYPVTFHCPYRGCLETFSVSQDCGMHVNAVQHPKTNQGDGKNWICAGDGKSFTSLDGLRSHINTSHLPKRHECQDCAYKTNSACHLKRHRDRWHPGSTQELKKWRHEQ